MKHQLILYTIAILLLVPMSASADNKAELEVKRGNATVLTLRFSDKSLTFFEQQPSQLPAVLREHGIDCCSSQTQISEALWKCCYGKFSLISSSARIQSILTAAFNGPKVVQLKVCGATRQLISRRLGNRPSLG